VVAARRIDQLYAVPLTRPSTVSITRALTKKRSKYTMLHMKRRDILVQRDLAAGARKLIQEVEQLGLVQVIRRGDPRYTLRDKPFGGERVSGIQAKVADERHPLVSKKMKSTKISHKNDVRFESTNLMKVAQLTRLKDSSRRDAGRKAQVSETPKGFTVFFTELEIEIHGTAGKACQSVNLTTISENKR
jgi:hypothetical protein